MKIKEISDVNKILTEISNIDNNIKKLDKEEMVILNLKIKKQLKNIRIKTI